MTRLLFWIRGGSWNFVSVYCRSAGRDYYTPDTRSSAFGFRVVRRGK